MSAVWSARAHFLLYGDTLRYPAVRHEIPEDGCETLTRYGYEL